MGVVYRQKGRERAHADAYCSQSSPFWGRGGCSSCSSLGGPPGDRELEAEVAFRDAQVRILPHPGIVALFTFGRLGKQEGPRALDVSS